MEQVPNIRSWYNDFAGNQLKTGVNLRHYKIVNKAIQAGLKKHHRVLEVGCGIGTLTGLLQRYLKKGSIVATDISDESIRIARMRIPGSDKINLIVSDMQNFSYPGLFDFVLLPDVIEHIPIEQHKALFGTLARHMHSKSVLLINLPHPAALDYYRANKPELLQVVDQSISAPEIVQSLHASHLFLTQYSCHSVFSNETDYVWLQAVKDNQLIITNKLKIKVILEKLQQRIKFLLYRIG